MNTNVQIIAELKAFLMEASQQKEKYCDHATAFTRKRKLSFSLVALFIINLVKKSLSIELDEFFTFLNKPAIPTKGAFSQARYKLKAVFFQDWNQCLINAFYRINASKQHQWKGFHLFGIDGTTISLPEHTGIKEEFGVHLNQAGQFTLGQIMVCYDVLNQVCIKSNLASAHQDELSIALAWVSHLPENSIAIYDRGYASFALVYLLNYYQKDFVIRCQSNFNQIVKDFVKSSQQTASVTFSATSVSHNRLQALGLPSERQTQVSVRLVKVILPTGETEVLITSLHDVQAFPSAVFKELYFFRWGVETYYDRLKNQLQIEIFTGQKSEAIYQEFYAMILVANLQALLVNDCEPELVEANQSRKYQHQINYNVTLGLMKNQLVALFLKQEPALIYQHLKSKFLKHTEAIRPHRTYERKQDRRRHRGKYYTWSNYRRAI